MDLVVVLLLLFVPRIALVAAGLVEAGSEFERLITGLRAVDGRGLGDGLYVWPEMLEPYDVALFSIPTIILRIRYRHRHQEIM